ncbi:MAG: hypothetical protein JO307_31960 [Bryobacterales bacterium]|nr:hypothetical protein [Bryobacterales bacterium]MBV9400023.1 hypothetical protein [Bryobacterales bacterium]
MNKFLFTLSVLAVSCTAAAQDRPKPSEGADLAKQILSAGLDETQCYRVRDLSLIKEDLRLYLTEGYLMFAKPVRGERWAAVFSGEVEGGDGEVLLLPPFRGERQSLAKFTQSPNLDEHFSGALLLFTDDSAAKLLDQVTRENRGKPAPEIGPLLTETWGPVLGNIVPGFELRLVGDLLTPRASRGGLMFAAVAGKTLGAFDLFYDSRAVEQVLAGRMVEHNSRYTYDVWTSFPARSFRNGTSPPPPDFVSERFQIDASLDSSLRLKATTRISIKVRDAAIKALPFEVSRAIEVTGARVDGKPAEFLFRDSDRARALRTDENDGFLLISPEPLASGSVHQIEFEEEGSVISTAGKDVYYVRARSNWYPRGGTDLSLYDLSFRYPRHLTLVTAGDLIEDRAEGDWRYTRRRTSTPIRVAGFNLGDYAHVTSAGPGFKVEVYGNRSLEASLVPKPQDSVPETAISASQGPTGRGGRRAPPLPVPPAPALPPDPLARLHAVAADVSSAVQMFSNWFGPPVVPNLTVAPIPGTFGQGFPGLLYLSTLAYLDPGARPPQVRGSRDQVFFSDLLQAHEAAHQWWGNVVLPAGYQDDWLPEALANYSALLYLERKSGVKAMQDVLEQYRDSLVKKGDDGQTVESAGPITLGFRLESAEPRNAWNIITYDKGAWVFHMLRRRLGDEQFLKMLAELRRRYEGRRVSTADVRALTKQFLPARVRASMIDSFFDNWVYSTGIPALKLTYTVKGAAPAVRLSGKVEQSGVDDDFSIEAPVEVQFAKGGTQTIWVETTNAGANFSATLKQLPAKVSIPTGTGVLATRK